MLYLLVVSLGGLGCSQKRAGVSSDLQERVVSVENIDSKIQLAKQKERQAFEEKSKLVDLHFKFVGYWRPKSYHLPILVVPFDCSDSVMRSLVGVKEPSLDSPVYTSKSGDADLFVCKRIQDQCRARGICKVKWSYSGKYTDRIFKWHQERLLEEHLVIGEKKSAFDLNRLCNQGYAAPGICRDSFHSLAFDPDYYKTGDVVYIPKFKGFEMPDRSVSTGYFVLREPSLRGKGPLAFALFSENLADTIYQNPIYQWRDRYRGQSESLRVYKVTDEVARLRQASRNYPFVQKMDTDVK